MIQSPFWKRTRFEFALTYTTCEVLPSLQDTRTLLQVRLYARRIDPLVTPSLKVSWLPKEVYVPQWRAFKTGSQSCCFIEAMSHVERWYTRRPMGSNQRFAAG